MPKQQNRVELKGSTRAALPGAQDVGPADPNEQIEVTVYLRPSGTKSPSADEIGSTPISEREYLSREQFARTHCASDEDVAKVRAFAADHGLQVTSVNAEARQVKLRGTVGAFATAFGTSLRHCQHSSGRYRVRTGNLTAPADVAPLIEAVLGLDNRPQAIHPTTEWQTMKTPLTQDQFEVATDLYYVNVTKE